jgi:hypothetical protein
VLRSNITYKLVKKQRYFSKGKLYDSVYRVRQATFLFSYCIKFTKRKLACRTYQLLIWFGPADQMRCPYVLVSRANHDYSVLITNFFFQFYIPCNIISRTPKLSWRTPRGTHEKRSHFLLLLPLATTRARPNSMAAGTDGCVVSQQLCVSPQHAVSMLLSVSCVVSQQLCVSLQHAVSMLHSVSCVVSQQLCLSATCCLHVTLSFLCGESAALCVSATCCLHVTLSCLVSHQFPVW